MIATKGVTTAMGLRDILHEEGHDCVIVEESCKAIDAIYHETPEMVMLDAALTKPTALDILFKLKAAPSTRDIPVIIIASGKSVHKIARCYDLGAYDYISRPFFREEIVARLRNIGYICEKMKELEKLLVRDYLTGLYNRKFFMERLVEELAWSARYSEPLSFIILDIDHFKRINDTYGHSCGDEVLRQLSKTLVAALRAHDVVARYGGEEFVVLLADTSTDDAVTTAEKLRVAVQECDFCCEENSAKLPVTISLGVASTTDFNFDAVPDSLITRADQALYEAKAAGRNRVITSIASREMKIHEG